MPFAFDGCAWYAVPSVWLTEVSLCSTHSMAFDLGFRDSMAFIVSSLVPSRRRVSVARNDLLRCRVLASAASPLIYCLPRSACLAQGAVSSHVGGCRLQCTTLNAYSARGVLDAAAAYLPSASQLLLGSGRRQLARGRLSAVMHSYTSFTLAVHAASWIQLPLPMLSASRLLLGSGRRQHPRGRLSASMHSYAGFMLAVHAVCWMQLPLTHCLPPSSYLTRGAVSTHMVGCRLQCTATRASCLQCTRRAGCSRRLLTVCLAALAWLGAPSACT